MQATIESILKTNDLLQSENRKLSNQISQKQSEFTKKNLLLLKALTLNREIKHKRINSTASILSEESLDIQSQNTKKRIAELKETIRNQRLQIHNLHQENNRLQERKTSTKNSPKLLSDLTSTPGESTRRTVKCKDSGNKSISFTLY